MIKDFISREKKVLKNISSLMILQILKYIFPLITMPYLLKTLGLEGYGLLVFSQTIANYFVMATNYGFYLSAPREISINRENIDLRNEIICSISIIKSCIFLLCLFIIILFINFVNLFTINKYVYLASMILVLNEVIFPIWFFQGIEEMDKITILNFFGRFFSIILMFIFVKSPNHVARAACIQATGGLISGIISIILLFKKYCFRFKKIKLDQIFYLLKSGWNLFISQLSTVLFSNINVTMLGIFSSSELVGIYSSGEKIVRLAVSLINPISTAIFPNISKIIIQSREQGEKKLKKILKLGTLIFLTISIMLFIFSNLIVKYLLGYLNLDVSTVIKVLSLLPTFIFINNIYGTQYMINCKLEKQFRNIIVISGLTLIILSFFLVQIFSVLGAAIASFLSELLLVFLMFCYIEFYNKEYGLLLNRGKNG